MKGKYAARSSNRSMETLERENASLRSEIESLRAAKAEVEDRLSLEISRLRVDLLAEAAKLAAPEVARRLTEVAEEHRKLGVSVEGMRSFMKRMDRFAFNACRYVSMITGEPPVIAMDSVLTWITGEDQYQIVDVDNWLLGHGLPSDGFIAWAIGALGIPGGEKKFAARRYAKNLGRLAVTLDEVEANRGDYPMVHPKYDPRWYGEVPGQ